MRKLPQRNARLYSFVNYYLSPLQHGLQTAHVVSDLFIKYNCYTSDPAKFDLQQWAAHHKTIIILNGGNQANLQEIFSFLNEKENPYPATYFCEDEQSLNNAVTCVGVIIPESVYEAASTIRGIRIEPTLTFEQAANYVNRVYGLDLSTYDYRLTQLLNSCKLA